MPTLTSRTRTVEIGIGLPTVLMNDQVRAMDQSPEILAELKEGKCDRLVEIAREGEEIGMDLVNILLTHPEVDEVEMLPKVAVAIHDEIGCPISLDTRNPEAIEATLEALKPYKVMIDSITAEDDCLESLLPLAKKYDAQLIGMPIGHKHGMPKDVKGRLEESEVMLKALASYGIPKENLMIDGMCLATSVEPNSMQVTLETLKALHEDLGVAASLGIGNAGHGMPEPTYIDFAYLIAAIPWGLDAAMLDHRIPGLIETVRAVDFLSHRDPYGKRYIKHYRKKRK